MSATILTSTAQYFFFDRPEEHDFDIEEIAHALAHLCRYTGHTRTFYSVAQHCVHVSHIVPREFALCGLMHDASEAYLGDVTKPLKMMLPDYLVIEERVEAAIATQHGLPFTMPDAVKRADLTMLVTEKRDLMPVGFNNSDDGRWPDIKPLPMVIRPWTSQEARQAFVTRYWELQ